MINTIKIFNEAINKAKSFECFSYRQEIIKMCDELEDEYREVVQLMINVLSYHMNENNPKQPFEPYAIFDGKRSAAINDLTDEDIKILENVYIGIEDCEIQARIADVIWTRDKKYVYGQDAIEKYLLSAERLENWEHWTLSFNRVKRALQLALIFGKTSDKVNQVNQLIKSKINNINVKDPSYLTGKLVELLLEQKSLNVDEFIDILEYKISNSQVEKNYNQARYYMELKSRCYKKSKLESEAIDTIKRIALSYEEEVKYIIETGNDNYILIAKLLEDAIQTYRRLPKAKEHADRLILKMEFYKKQISENLKEFTNQIDITNIISEIRKSFKDKEKKVSLIKLAYIQSINTKKSLEDRVIEMYKNSPLSFLVSTDIIDSNGRRITRMPNLDSGSEEENRIAIEAHMLKEAANNHSISASVLTSSALSIIKEQNTFKKDEFEFLVKDNLFIPEGREEIFLEGLYEGFKGNFMKSIHLLIPQLENSFREFAKLCGDNVTTFEDDGKEQVKSLNSIFELPNFVEAFDEDLLFDLRSLLTEKYGSNMRNKLAHGLLSYDEASSSISVYVWWICLRLCCMYSNKVNQYISENKTEFGVIE
ncbi:DUF4209 domain-containing protein [Bacillus sp. CLL-7-23]|uniref:DUF4209 domain-containing protein n=1 Tax=Bacillus changyiensis TaxID=3004103 RepID=A0ABT4X4L7_9BACI|nr:DUF4209 domain-containing protein [Bacillus changyiensis]MDA7027242.1 DUF4209 domain-containing protein [Bacillus changyiensis]